MKETMKAYFERFYEMWEGYNASLPQISFNEDIDTRLYIGEMYEEEYIFMEGAGKKDCDRFI